MKKMIPSGIKRGYILILPVILPIFTLICCTENKSKADRYITIPAKAVQSVKVVSAGGEMGFSSNTLMDKDSIHYSRTVATNETQNLSYSRKVKPEDWKKLVDSIDLKLFGAVKEGKSVQPVDGIDTRIIITTSAGEISKMNAYDDSAWKNIRDIIDQYNELYR